MPIAKILVAYKTQLIPELVPNVNSFLPPSNYKSEDAIAGWKEKKAASLNEECLSQPYTATFAEVMLVDIANQRRTSFKYRGPDSAKKQCASVAIRTWLLKEYPDAWPHTTNPTRGEPQAIFMGFNPKLFIKILGIECSLPCNQPKLANTDQPDPEKLVVMPLSAWYSNSDHRDIGEAVKPKDYTSLTWDIVLQARGLQAKYAQWKGPHENVERDLNLTIDLATQLGMFRET